MERAGIKYKTVLFCCVVLFITLPFIQYQTGLIKTAPLKGAISEPEKPVLSTKTWFDGEFQPKLENYLKEKFGFREFAIRINNQIAYSLFNRAKANGVLRGKEDYLYEENYLKAYYGLDFIGADSITENVRKLKAIQDTLASLNKQLIVIFAPGKGCFYPEYFPKEYQNLKKGATNLETYISSSKQSNLKHIDFSTWFLQMKETSAFPLYPKTGIHWSVYGKVLAVDSLIKYIENHQKIDIPDLVWNSTESSYLMQETDKDIEEGMNLLWGMPHLKMGYPKIDFVEEKKIKPKVITIADSYYWGIYGTGIASKLFSDPQFWFYYNEFHPQESGKTQSKIDIKKEIAENDIFLLISTDANLPNLGWGFIDSAYNAYFPADSLLQ